MTNLRDGSFRDSFNFITPFHFQQSVASDPAPLPGGKWKYPVDHGGANVVATPESSDPKPLYQFGKGGEMRDLEMRDLEIEDSFSGSVDPLLVGGVYQTVSVCAYLASAGASLAMCCS
jgi:hypothetical protein